MTVLFRCIDYKDDRAVDFNNQVFLFKPTGDNSALHKLAIR